MGIALNVSPIHPSSPSAEDVQAARRRDGALFRWFADPVFGRGYPDDMLEAYSELAPTDAIDAAAVPLDFLGLNYSHVTSFAWAADGSVSRTIRRPASSARRPVGRSIPRA